VCRYVEGKELKQCIVVPNRIVTIVAR